MPKKVKLKTRKAHPYTDQPERARWKLAVAGRDPFGLSDVYRKKFEILPTDRISALGSCFAQHVGRHLHTSGFAYQDFEPPLPFLPTDHHHTFGYSIFSVRYGKVYTVRQLLQLYQRAWRFFADRGYLETGRTIL